MKRNTDKIPDIASIFIAVCTVIFLGIFIAVSYLYSLPSVTVCIISCIIYLAVTFFGSFFIKKYVFGSKSSSAKLSTGIFASVVSDMSIPVALFDEQNKICKINKAFETVIGPASLFIGKAPEDFMGISLEQLIASDNGARIRLTLHEAQAVFDVKVHVSSIRGKNFYVTLWHDITKTLALESELEDSKPLYGFIIADNINESFSAAGTDIREALDKTEEIILEWASGYGASVTVIGSGKYMVLMRKGCVEELIENDFDIYKRVKEAKIGLTGYSVTISGGFSAIDGTDEEIMNAARSACEMAIQRGGDQIGYKDGANIRYFGGSTKASQVSSKINVRVDANKLASLIKSSSNVIIMGHKNIDYDCIGACIGLYRLAHYCSKQANIVIEFPIEEQRARFQNTLNAFSLLGDGAEYRHAFVDKYEAGDLISSNTLLILADVSESRIMEHPELLHCAPQVAYVDHHQKKEEFLPTTVLKCISTAASSTCELVAGMLEVLTPPGILRENEATLMLAGIMLDTFNFMRNTRLSTFAAAQYLASEKASSDKAAELFHTAIGDYQSENEFEKNVRIIDGIAFAVKYSVGDDNDKTPCARVADRLAALHGIAASFAMYEKDGGDGDNVIVVSGRSRGQEGGINVGKIFENIVLTVGSSVANGGGDFEKGAVTLKAKSLKEAEHLIRKAIIEYRKTLNA